MRPDLPGPVLDRLHDILRTFPECVDEPAWVGVRWRVRGATVAHAFGGEDGAFRIVFRAEPGEVLAFENMGGPYFRTGWGENTVGIVLDDETDWTELAEMLTDSYCVQAPAALADSVDRPGN
ncbi:MAG: MmcQ/YjbR family DNA-binding protein [Rhodococcus sp. (in: high G+C Gram-positive bacteria)]|uniref:MmcQ/YjbR family DNA-binding protein n=1 Tax=Rhodococcus sp. TaxID=1831 RepID=UPI003BB766AD